VRLLVAQDFANQFDVRHELVVMHATRHRTIPADGMASLDR
jgi:hypothetical protein